MGEGIVLGRVGHYFDAGNGSCSTALVVDAFVPDDAAEEESPAVNVVAWHHGGDQFSRTSVPVDAEPSTAAAANSFHLTRDCPWGR